MKIFTVLLFFIAISYSIFSQNPVNLIFSKYEKYLKEPWTGDIRDFKIKGGYLASSGEQSQEMMKIAYPLSLEADLGVVWEFSFERTFYSDLDFAVRFYLAAENAKLAGQSYFVEFNNEDSNVIFKQNNEGSIKSVIAAVIPKKQKKVDVQVYTDRKGKWGLSIDGNLVGVRELNSPEMNSLYFGISIQTPAKYNRSYLFDYIRIRQNNFPEYFSNTEIEEPAELPEVLPISPISIANSPEKDIHPVLLPSSSPRIISTLFSEDSIIVFKTSHPLDLKSLEDVGAVFLIDKHNYQVGIDQISQDRQTVVLKLDHRVIGEDLNLGITSHLKDDLGSAFRDTTITLHSTPIVVAPTISKTNIPSISSIILKSQSIIHIRTSSVVDSLTVKDVHSSFILNNENYKLIYLGIGSDKRHIKMRLEPELRDGELQISTTHFLKNYRGLSFRDTIVTFVAPKLLESDVSLVIAEPLTPVEIVKKPLLLEVESNKLESPLLDLEPISVSHNSGDTEVVIPAYVAGASDVIINEIMVDPSPVVGLPDVEYIEIFNQTSHDLSLNAWNLHFESKVKPLPNYLLKANTYALLLLEDHVSLFPDSIQCIGLASMPILRNSDGEVKLSSTEGIIIDSFAYKNSWWGDSSKKKGGWSLERKGVLIAAGQKVNWKSSSNENGGTPGYMNSIEPPIVDTIAPILNQFVFYQPQKIELNFSEVMDESSCLLKDNYTWEGNVGEFSLSYVESSVVIDFSEPISESELYILTVSGIQDLAKNKMDSAKFQFGIPSLIDSGDIIINEILFNAYSGDHEYIELFNRSTKVLNLQELGLLKTDQLNGIGSEIFPLASDPLLLPPNSLIVFDGDNNHIPSLPNKSAYLSLVELAGKRKVIDQAYYNERMHADHLSEVKGVALERISSSHSGLDKNNWQSSKLAFSGGFGSPGLVNDSKQNVRTLFNKQVSLSDDYLSPDGDGMADELTILFHLNEPGWMTTVSVFNTRGRHLGFLSNNHSIENGEGITWAGGIGNHDLLPPGVYIIYVKLYHSRGRANEYKFSVSLQ